MGYDLHISRAEDWVDSKTTPITLDEWKSYVDSDPELKIDPVNNHREDELMVLWYGDGVIPGSPEDNEDWLCWHNGEIYTKNPEDVLIKKMCKIAAFFNAKVTGDDAEEYVLTANGLDSIPFNEKTSSHSKKSNVLIRFLNTTCKVLVVILAEPLAVRMEKFRSRWFGND